MPENYKRKPNCNCKICNKQIYKRPLQITENGGNVFCSNACYGIACRKEIPCVICGKLILGSLHKKTCSRTCSNKNRAGIKYKLNDQRKDKVKSQQSLKIRLLKVRGFECERCGYKKYEILQIHHKDRDRGNNNLDNLELICPNCHYEEHFLEKSWLKKIFKNQLENNSEV
jgi:Zn finger protein HypA/HybF involved in hydrogenase expression